MKFNNERKVKEVNSDDLLKLAASHPEHISTVFKDWIEELQEE